MRRFRRVSSLSSNAGTSEEIRQLIGSASAPDEARIHTLALSARRSILLNMLPPLHQQIRHRQYQ